MRLPVLVLLTALAWGQETPPPAPPPLEFTGKPVVVPFQCTEEDMQLAGLSCSETDPCPIYLELAAVAKAGNRILLAGNLHSAVVTLFSVLLASEDDGRTWREANDRVRGALLDRIQFFDAETGWIAGGKLAPLPQDPFLLLTSDGGKTWNARPVFGDSAENKLGTIHQVYFSARDSGALAIDRGQGSDEDRYELYESPDGGQSWSFRQSSRKPIPIKGAPESAAATEWRLRAETRTKAYHVERREGARWTEVAAFAVHVGACKP